jgi:phage host-nuclease inhibitor protein Gam
MARTAAKLKSKGLNLPVPQTREQAADAIFEIGAIDRDLQRLDAGLRDALAGVKRGFEEQAQPLHDRRGALIEGVKVFCEARRDELTGGRTKTAAFTSGEVSWRLRPPSVKIRGGEDNMVLAIQSQARLDMKAFLRVKYEINREAMLANRDLALTLPGVTISSEGEDFEVKPFDPDGLEGA